LIRKGELKKISIGYELVTNPSLVLLDEPTSGLDSISAFNIAKLLKKESRRGLTIIATIHTPSAETFLQFDRCILLAEGFTIYNGSPHHIRNYFEEKGF
jgi:ATP-binding cassette, subfamily G (WHITE), eye pigment precursor transporter